MTASNERPASPKGVLAFELVDNETVRREYGGPVTRFQVSGETILLCGSPNLKTLQQQLHTALSLQSRAEQRQTMREQRARSMGYSLHKHSDGSYELRYKGTAFESGESFGGTPLAPRSKEDALQAIERHHANKQGER